MNDLQNFFEKRPSNDINKWSNYFDLYENYFSKFRTKPIHFLEIGVDRGGSSQMWKAYFGADALVVGIDINPECKKFENPEENRYVEIGDQSDPDFLKELIEKYEYFDIILDDGSHFPHHQIASFKYLWDYIAPNGIYMVEDIQTSYYLLYNSYTLNKNSFIEYSKQTIDEINIYHQAERIGTESKIPHLYGVYFHSGMVIFEKRPMPIPISCRSSKDSVKTDAVKEAANQISYIYNASIVYSCRWYIQLLLSVLCFDKQKFGIYKHKIKTWRILNKRQQKGKEKNE